MRPPITALIPCKDEERHIGPCMDSVRWCDEILVGDSGSTDRSKEIAREKGARIIEREYVHYASFNNWAIPQCSHEWVLLIDSDERCTPELRREIEALLEKDPGTVADMFVIGRTSFFLGQQINHCGWDTDELPRFFHRDRCEFPNRMVHASLQFKEAFRQKERIGHLKGKLLHYTYTSLNQYLTRKFVPFTSRASEVLVGKGLRKASLVNLTLRPMFRFFKMYFLRLGFLDGKAGLVLCTLAAFSVFMKYAKLWAIFEAPEKTPLSEKTTLPPEIVEEVRKRQEQQ